MNTPQAIVPPTIGQLVNTALILEYTGTMIRVKPTICKTKVESDIVRHCSTVRTYMYLKYFYHSL